MRILLFIIFMSLSPVVFAQSPVESLYLQLLEVVNSTAFKVCVYIVSIFYIGVGFATQKLLNIAIGGFFLFSVPAINTIVGASLEPATAQAGESQDSPLPTWVIIFITIAIFIIPAMIYKFIHRDDDRVEYSIEYENEQAPIETSTHEDPQEITQEQTETRRKIILD